MNLNEFKIWEIESIHKYPFILSLLITVKDNNKKYMKEIDIQNQNIIGLCNFLQSIISWINIILILNFTTFCLDKKIFCFSHSLNLIWICNTARKIINAFRWMLIQFICYIHCLFPLFIFLCKENYPAANFGPTSLECYAIGIRNLVLLTLNKNMAY